MKNLLLILFISIYLNGVSQQFTNKLVKSVNHINFIGLDSFDSTVLINTSKFVGQYLDCEVSVSNKTFQISQFLTKGPKFLKVESFMSSVKNDTLTVYITNRSLMFEGIFAKGVSSPSNSTILVDGRKSEVNSIVIHEIGHLLGLEHCEEINCSMSNNYSESLPKFCSLCHDKFFR